MKEMFTSLKGKKFSTPYIKGVSERVERILKPHNIMLAHKSKTTIKTKLGHLKDSREATEKNNAVYKINCKNCSCSYIGETIKKVGDRLKEHKRNITTAYEQSQIFQHIRDSGYTFNFKEVQVIQQSKMCIHGGNWRIFTVRPQSTGM